MLIGRCFRIWIKKFHSKTRLDGHITIREKSVFQALCLHASCTSHLLIIFCVFLLGTSIYLKAYGEVFWLQLFTSMAWNWWVLKITNLQSWTKSVKNFALSHPQNTCPMDLVLLEHLPSPHPGQCCSMEVRNDPATPWPSTLFSWGKGEVFVVTSHFKSFILKQDMAKSIFLHIFVQDCSSLIGYSRKNPPPIMQGIMQETLIPSDMCSPTHKTKLIS